MAGEGQILRNARVDKGWSLTQAEEVTKIRIRYLEALEEEAYHILPGTTYTKGFLRTYAKHLGISPEEVLERYKASEQQPEKPLIVEPVPPPRKKPQWIKPALVAITGVVALVVVIGIASLSKPQGTNVAPDNIITPLPTAPPEEIAQQPENTPPVQTPPQNPQNVIAQENEGVVAQLVFSQPCWIRVNVDGQFAFEGTFTQGATKELRAKEQIELVTVGNAGGLTVTLNGKAWPSLGAQGQVVHNIILKKDTESQVSFVP
ncbi:MAG TPA: helix-turn-helix domain-containing protein [Desulfitobacterium dehalogenans]|uniref:Helix-turn-helix domain-containing protein n=1 Tax=Desulfitobacterium dehalogenans TaxID=36854 RepID=A0A7C7D660_9FIRM|nr:helix-turn-helix domain-containing protein [Desulfitobacterium dehalogenans]